MYDDQFFVVDQEQRKTSLGAFRVESAGPGASRPTAASGTALIPAESAGGHGASSEACIFLSAQQKDLERKVQGLEDGNVIRWRTVQISLGGSYPFNGSNRKCSVLWRRSFL